MVLHPSLLHSEQKGIKVLILAKDREKTDAFEARTENDSEMQRVDVLSVASIIEAEKIIKRSEPLLVVYEDGFQGKDAIGIQMQLRHIDSKLLFVPVLSSLALPTISQLQRIGNVYDYAESGILENYDALKSLILAFVRSFSAKDGVLADILKTVNPIRHSLLAGFRVWTDAKEKSQDCVRVLLAHYDLSVMESAMIVAGDRIFIPDVGQAEYQRILSGSVPDVLEVIKATGNWKTPSRAPQSVAGFLVTAATLLAERYQNESSLDSVRRDLDQKATALRHPAARALTPTILAQVESMLCDRNKKVA